METNKSNNYLLAFLISSFFFTNYIIGEILINRVGRGSILILILANFLVPIIYLILTPLYEKIRRLKLNHMTIVDKTTPFYFIIRIVLSIYLVLSLIICIYFSTNFLTTYFFQNLPITIYFILLVFLIGYSLKEGIKSILLFANLFIFITLAFYIFYLGNQSSINYNNINNFRISFDNIVLIIIMILPILFEPFLLLVFGDSASSRYKKRNILLFTIVGVLAINYTFVRQLWEFGALLPFLHSPFFESIKFLQIGNYSENGDLFAIIFWIGLTFIRLLFTCSLFNKLWNLRGLVVSSVLLFFCCAVALLFLQNVNVFSDIMYSLIIIAIFTLIGFSVLILILVLKGGKDDARTV